jgi:hypothetical protein
MMRSPHHIFRHEILASLRAKQFRIDSETGDDLFQILGDWRFVAGGIGGIDADEIAQILLDVVRGG